MELKPCPFCGRIDRVVIAREGHDPSQYQVICDASGHADLPNRGCGGSCGFYDSIDEAVEAWNRRVNDGTDAD